MNRRNFLVRMGRGVLVAAALALGVGGQLEIRPRIHPRMLEMLRPLQDEIDFLQNYNRQNFRRLLHEVPDDFTIHNVRWSEQGTLVKTNEPH